MRMFDLIEKKKRGFSLSEEEIREMITGFVEGHIPDYQMSAMLMAICFQGMTKEETTALTLAMEHSGDVMDLSPISGIKVDKHSTGGVGDKTTLIVAPIVAACGARVAKMSGRGMGHTGGTVDKLESIPGFRTSLSREEFFSAVNQTGIAVIGQTGNMVPADKKLYALRDVTATIDCIPLIASSIMSKKLAAGSDAILLDVKTGSGAFMKTREDAVELAKSMVSIGELAGRKTVALITEMGIPLGHAVGNALEVEEAIRVLQGEGPEDLTWVCQNLAMEMLLLAGRASSREEAKEQVKKAITSGRALETLRHMVEVQGGDAQVIGEPSLLPKAPCTYQVCSLESGYVTAMDAEAIGISSMLLGAGRQTKEDIIDPAAGIRLCKKYGDPVEEGDVLAILYSSEEHLFANEEKRLREAYQIGQQKPKNLPLIHARVDGEGVFLREE